MATIQQSIEMQRGGQNTTGTNNTYVEVPLIMTRLNTADFDGTVTYYFEAAMNNTGTNGTTTAYAQLYNQTDGVPVANSEISTTRNNGIAQRMRSGSLALSGDKIYTIRLKHSVLTTSTQVYSARIVVVQQGTITKTQIHHELGHETGVSSTSNTNRYTGSMKFLYEASRYDGSFTVRHAAVLRANSGNTVTSGLYDETADAVVSGSEVSTALTNWTYVQSTPLTLIDGHVYRPTAYVSAGAAVWTESNRIVFTMTNFTRFLAYIALHSPWSDLSTTSTSFIYNGDYQQNLAFGNFTGCSVQYYFEGLSSISSAAETSSAKLATIDNVAGTVVDVAGTTVTNTGSTTENRVRSGQLLLSSGAQDYGVGYMTSSNTATARLRNAYIIAAVRSIGKNGSFAKFF